MHDDGPRFCFWVVVGGEMDVPVCMRLYVDDTFVLWPHGEHLLEAFHKHLNSQHPAIQFTKEVESEKQLPFLEVLVERSEKSVSTGVYRKKTHTDRYIHFTSHHHPKAKSWTIKCLRTGWIRYVIRGKTRRDIPHQEGFQE